MAKQTHDDLFEGSTMSFGEHLEELRVALFRSIGGIVLTCIVGFIAADRVVIFFQAPLDKAMKSYSQRKAERELIKQLNVTALPPELRNVIYDRELVPEPVEVETAPLISVLKQMFPEQLGNVHLSAHLFLGDDLKPGQERGLCQALLAASEAEAPSPAKRIWILLSESQQITVRKLAGGEGELDAADRNLLLGVLNSVAGRKELHDAPEFLSLTESEAATVTQIREALAKKFDAEESRRLNKLLLSSVFSDSLRAPHINMIPLAAWKLVKIRFQVLNAQEAFMIWMKAGLVTGLVLGSPWIFYQIWNFVAAGLYPHEKNYVYLYMPISLLLFFGGASLAYLFVFDPVLNFLFQFNDSMNAEFDPRIGEWLGFVLILPLGFGVGFQLPLVMFFLNRIGLVSIELYIKQWRIAILTIFVVAMVLTPADPYSFLLMALPLCLLYVVGVLMCKWMPRGRNPFAEAYEP